ncbi:hypothetical protein ACW7BJ_34970 [Azospirillum argentinense]|uniref:Uncharacterized protein n=1 Tax=Azospirillum argentinense TaxID=2970906 RepID=A0ABW8VDG9_9PROT|nr:hypothetical protein [Azospirillum argentinense]
MDLLASRLKPPLQIEQHLTLAFEKAFRIGFRSDRTSSHGLRSDVFDLGSVSNIAALGQFW